MAFKDKDEFLDKLFDHIVGEDDPTDDDQAFFEHLSTFFDQFEGDGNSGNSGSSRRRRPNANSNNSNGGSGGGGNVRRRPRSQQSGNSGNSGSGSYGSGLFFGRG